MRVKATGGGAYKYAEVFRTRLGLILEKEDEMACMVDGCNFLLKAGAFCFVCVFLCSAAAAAAAAAVAAAPTPLPSPAPRPPPQPPPAAVRHEAFEYENGSLGFVGPDSARPPYLLVNIGSGVSMVRVDEGGKHTRVSGEEERGVEWTLCGWGGAVDGVCVCGWLGVGVGRWRGQRHRWR